MKTHTTQLHGDDRTPTFLACSIQVSSFNNALPPPVRCFNLHNAPPLFLSGLYQLLPPELCLSASFKAVLFCCFVPFFPTFPFIAAFALRFLGEGRKGARNCLTVGLSTPYQALSFPEKQSLYYTANNVLWAENMRTKSALLVLSFVLLSLQLQLQSWQFPTLTFTPLNLRSCIFCARCRACWLAQMPQGGKHKIGVFFFFETWDFS